MRAIRPIPLPIRKCLGLTLVEVLLVTLLVALVLALGSPGFGRMIEQLRVESGSRALLGAINLARHEAIVRGHAVSLCPSRLGAGGAVVCSGTFSNGWIVFANRNRDAVVDAGEDSVLRVFSAVPRGYRVMNKRGSAEVGGVLHYLADGTAHRNLTLQVCPPNPDRVRAVSIVLNIVGRARLDRAWGQCEPLA